MASFIDPATVRRAVLPNGLTVLIRRDASAPVVAIVTHVKAGYFDETDDVIGIAHVLEHMYFKGTEKRGPGEIAKETKGSGGYLNAHTIYDQTVYYTVLPSSGFVSGLEIQADAYANSVIDAGELSKELEVIIQEAKRKTDNPSALAVETLYELLHDRHRMRRWRIGHEEGLRRLTRDDMMRFYRNFYRPSNTILSVVGDVDPDDAMTRIASLYGALEDRAIDRTPGPEEPHHDELRYRELAGDIAQSQLVMGWRTQHAKHEDTPVLDFAGHLLGAGRASRLYRSLRDRQLVSSVSAYNYVPTEIGVFVIHAEAPPNRVVEAASTAWDQVRALREDPIDSTDMERVRRIFEARWMRRLESMEGQANHLAEWEALGAWELADEYYGKFMAVSADQVHEVAARYLTEERAGMVVYRPASTPALASDAAAFVGAMRGQPAEPLDPLPARDEPPAPSEAPAPAFLREEAGISVFETEEGTSILVRPKPGAAFASLAVQAVGGVRDEDVERAGITSLAMRTSVKGTASRTAEQIAEDAEMLGGSIGVSAGVESFGWSISVPVQHLEAAVDLLADVIREAVIPDEALEVERAVLLSEIAAQRDDMFRFPMRLLLSRAYEGHPYSQSPLGTEESLQSLTVEDVRQWHRAALLGSRFTIGVVADVVPSDVAGVIARSLRLPKQSRDSEIPVPSWPRAEASAIEPRDKAQTALALAFPGPSRRDDRRYAAQITAMIASGLGGRFFDELRDRQSLAYTVHAFASELEHAGMFLSYIATSPEKEDVARQGLLREFDRLRSEPVTSDELERAKRYAIGSNAIRQESGGAILSDLLDAWMFGAGLSELGEYESRISALTVDDIQSLAREYFDPARRVEGIVRGVGREV
jgi:zinc protease